MSKNSVDRFNFYELLFFRIQLLILGFAALLLTSFIGVAEFFKSIRNLMALVVYIGFILPILLFLLSVIRILKYIFVISKQEEKTTIWRSALILLFSPLSFGLYLLVFFILGISSCSIAGA